jgi:hypothetical protein
MRAQLPGYYRYSDEELAAIWETALVVPDTNVLLRLYQLSEPTREKLLAILKGFEARLFVPYQVAFEFQERRLEVIDAQKAVYDEVDKELGRLPKAVVEGLREHPRIDKGKLEQKIEKALKPVREGLATDKEGHPDPLGGGHALGADSIRDAIDALIGDRVGQPGDEAELLKLGPKRYERKQPPGYEDKDKPAPRCYGDLAIWLETIACSEAEGKPVILITEERKQDWWWIWKGKRIGPRPEMVAELAEKAQQSLLLYNLAQFMQKGASALGLEFSEDEREDVTRAQQSSGEVERGAGAAALWRRRVSGRLDPANPQPWGDPPPGPYGWVERSAAAGPAHSVSGEAFYSGQPYEAPDSQAMRWSSEAAVGAAQVELGLGWPPAMAQIDREPTMFTCHVVGPAGGRSKIDVLAQAPGLQCRYPQDFAGEREVSGGAYRYTWIRHGSMAGTLGVELDVEVASGSFFFEGL